MSFGSHFLRFVTFGFIGLVIYTVLQINPNGLQGAADAVFFFQSNPQYRLYSLVALIVSVSLLLTVIAVHSIKHEDDVEEG